MYEKIDYKKLKGNLKVLDKIDVLEKDVTDLEHQISRFKEYLKKKKKVSFE